MIKNSVKFSVALYLIAAAALSVSTSRADAQEKNGEVDNYAHATDGIVEFQREVGKGMVERWKLLLDESNLGGKELELAELTLPAGLVVGGHHHGVVEIFYVLSGTLDHEVNGKMHRLKPGMVGVVRPEDSVRHVVPKDGDAKVLVIWAPAGEAKKFFDHARNKTTKQN